MSEFRAPLLVLGSAIAMTAGSAHAALVSTAGTSFSGVTITTSSKTSNSYSFDLNGDGTADFTVSGTGSAITLSGITGSDAAATYFGNIVGTTDPTSLSLSSIKNNSGVVGSGLVAGQTNYIALATNYSSGTSGILGYIEGVYTPQSTVTSSSGTESRFSTSSSDESSWSSGDCGPGGTTTTTLPASFEILDFGLIQSPQPPSGISTVPEPASWAMMIAGFGGIGFMRRRRGKTGEAPRFAI